jgi:sporulation protein YlmC with PRC-barrel domain
MNILQTADMEVIGLNGFIIGTLQSLDFDSKTWQVRSLVVELDSDVAREFDLKKLLRGTRVLIDVNNVQGVGDKITLKTGKEDLMAEIKSLGQTT